MDQWQKGHSKQDLERVKKALTKLHTNMGHPGVKEMVRVLKHGRADDCIVMSVLKCATKTPPTSDSSSSAGLQ